MIEDEKFWMLKAMRVYGGGFAKALGEAWIRADSGNSAKLEMAFPELVKQYVAMGKTLKERGEREANNE